MKWLVPLALIVLLQSSPSVSRKQSNEVGKKSKQTSKQEKPLGEPAPSQSPANAPNQDAQRTKDQSQNNEVKVSFLPREIEIKAVKDSIDKTILGCTIVLTIVGAVGTYVGVKTLFAIERQAHIMEEHRTSLEQLAEAANKNAEAALLNAKAVIKS